MNTPVPARPWVLALNAGSSSLKAGLYAGQGQALHTWSRDGLRPGPALDEAVDDVLAQVGRRLADPASGPGARVAAVVHRIVHGGDHFVQPCRLDADTLRALARLSALAPLHQPHNLAAVARCAALWPDVPQIGCFDTAFHASLPDVERRLPLPRALTRQGLRRYGFHGLAYASVLGQLQQQGVGLQARVVMAHLGSGASVCAVHHGCSVATSMGFSALDGLMMGTRCGSLDPGVVLHLLHEGWGVEQLQQLLYRESGLLGVSGVSADWRALRNADDPRAAAALALFTHRVVREIGAQVAVLGGLDVLAFSGGIGEHDAMLRAEVVAALGYLGARLDANANGGARPDTATALHGPGSAVQLWCVPADEAGLAARAALAWLHEHRPLALADA